MPCSSAIAVLLRRVAEWTVTMTQRCVRRFLPADTAILTGVPLGRTALGPGVRRSTTPRLTFLLWRRPIVPIPQCALASFRWILPSVVVRLKLGTLQEG